MLFGMNLVELIENYGIKGLLIFVLVTIIGGLLKPDVIGKFFSSISSKFKKKDTAVNESNVINHDLFNFIDFWSTSKIPTLSFSTEYREIIFRKYLIIYIKSYKDGISEFIDDGDYKEMDQSQLWKEFLNVINNIVFNYEKDALAAGIPDIVVKKMKAKNNDTIQLMIDLVNSISKSDFYESNDNYLKLYSILNIILSILENTITNAGPVCDSINGELKGLTMDGKTEP